MPNLSNVITFEEINNPMLEDGQMVYVDGVYIGRLTWSTGVNAGWHFEAQDTGNPAVDFKTWLVCPLDKGLDKDEEMILLTVDEVKELATKWLLSAKSPVLHLLKALQKTYTVAQFLAALDKANNDYDLSQRELTSNLLKELAKV